MNKLKKHLGILILILIGLTPILWYRPGMLIHGLDVGLPIDYPSYFQKGLSTWNDSMNTGVNSTLKVNRVFEYFLLKGLYVFGLDTSQMEIAYFSAIMILTLLGFYFFASEVRKENDKFSFGFPIFSSIFYLFNLFSLTRYEGVDRAIFYVMIGVPLILAFFLRNFKKESFTNYFFLCLSAILLSNATINTPSFLTGVLLIFVFYLAALVEVFIRKDRQEIKKRLLTGIKSLFLVVVTNLFWLIPYVVLGSPGEIFEKTAPADWLASMSVTATYQNVVRLIGAWHWFDSSGGVSFAPYAEIYFKNKFFLTLTYIAPLFVLGGIIIAVFRKKPKTFSLLFLLLVGIVLSMGSNGFFGKFYFELYKAFYLFKIFRSPWFKFNVFTILAYAFFYGVFASFIVSLVKNKLKFGFVWIVFSMLFIAFPIMLTKPLLTGSVFSKFWVKIPDTVIDSVKYLDKNAKAGDRVLLLPFTNEGNNYPWGYLGVSPILYYLSNIPTFGAWENSSPGAPVNLLLKSFRGKLYSGQDKNISDYLSLLGVKYILHQKDITFFNNDPPEFIKGLMANQDNITFSKEFGSWDIYENYKPVNLFSFRDKVVKVKDADIFLKSLPEDMSVFYSIANKVSLSSSVERLMLSPKDFIANGNFKGEYRFNLEAPSDYLLQVTTSKPIEQGSLYLDQKTITLTKGEKPSTLSVIVSLNKGAHVIEADRTFIEKDNLIKNGNFTEEIENWDLVIDGSYFGDMSRINHSLRVLSVGRAKLKAVNWGGAAKQKISGLKKNQKYRLRFTYKNLTGWPLRVGVLKSGSVTEFIVDPTLKDFYSKEEQVGEITFSTGDLTDVDVGFYAQLNAEDENSQQIGDISLNEVEDYETIEMIPVLTTDIVTPVFQKISPTKYKVNLQTKDAGWLFFNNTFDPGWEAYDNGQKLEHTLLDNYANGFFIPSGGRHDIVINFSPESLFGKMLKISSVCMILIALLALLEKVLHLTKKKSK